MRPWGIEPVLDSVLENILLEMCQIMGEVSGFIFRVRVCALPAAIPSFPTLI